MKKWWKEPDGQALIESFLHYYQASDSELTSVAGCLLLVDFNLSFANDNGSIFCLIFRFQSQIFTDDQGILASIRCMMWLPRLSEKF